MTKKNFLLTAVSCGAFQVSAMNYFSVFGVKPDLVLINVVLASLFFEFRWALIFSVFSGLFKDIFGPAAFGINTVIFPLWSLLVIKLSKEISFDNKYICAALIVAVVIINSIIARFIFFYLGNSIPAGIFLRITFLEAVYAASVSFLIFRLARISF